jgi:hypothetical protein
MYTRRRLLTAAPGLPLLLICEQAYAAQSQFDFGPPQKDTTGPVPLLKYTLSKDKVSSVGPVSFIGDFELTIWNDSRVTFSWHAQNASRHARMGIAMWSSWSYDSGHQLPGYHNINLVNGRNISHGQQGGGTERLTIDKYSGKVEMLSRSDIRHALGVIVNRTA